ncbi:hypothetical protein EVAR_89143_1 [Eumeta japonica]|uniref:Uncharacterized protein n=1 Tax=Eumeta variegata TaxID=151549 RepID=A0A4C1ZR53_EUMVA|nr:hypothetical protein EVAR_89143_1 [Eumeta japonica]
MPSVAVVAVVGLDSGTGSMSPNVTVRFSSLSVLDKWDALSQSIKSPESSSSASRRSNNILYARPRLVQLSFHFPIAQILIEPITRRAASVAPCSHFCSNRQCSTDVRDFGFAYLPLEAKCCIRCAGFIRSVDSVGSRIRMQVTNFLVDPLLPRRTSAQVFIRTVVPLQFFNLQSLTVPNSSYEVLETRICSIRGWKTGRVGVARSTVDMHRVRVRNRASVGATVARRAYSPAPYLCMRIDATRLFGAEIVLGNR